MPELPEVEVVRRGLEAHVLGRPIRSVEVLHPRPVRRHAGGPDDFEARLTGRTFTAAHRRGKYLWLSLDDGGALLGHLGMSGQMLVQPPGVPDERNLRVRFLLAEPDSPRVDTRKRRRGRAKRLGLSGLELRFVDQRMFGGLAVSEGGAELPPEIAHIARDPLDAEFDDDAFVRRVRRSESGIKRMLLNQSIVSGVGNIYADEGLWMARVHGERPGSRLRRSDVRRVLTGCREVMLEALGQGGTSFDALYVNVNGQSGYFERSLKVYGREAEPCPRCGTPIRRITFMNRSSYFCPVCQPVPRRAAATGQPRDLMKPGQRETLVDGPDRSPPPVPGRHIYGQGASRLLGRHRPSSSLPPGRGEPHPPSARRRSRRHNPAAPARERRACGRRHRVGGPGRPRRLAGAHLNRT